MSIKDEIIELREAVEKFAESHNISTEEASEYLLEKDLDARNIPQGEKLKIKP